MVIMKTRRSPYEPQEIKINGEIAVLQKEDTWTWMGYFKKNVTNNMISGVRHASSKESLLRMMGYTQIRVRPYKPRKRLPQTKLYEDIKRKSSEIGETNDCGVISLTVATGEAYEDCHAALELSGRKPDNGTYDHEMKKAASILGYTLNKFEIPEGVKTMKTAEKYMPNGNYVLTVSEHYAGMSNGKVHDWARGRSHQIQYIWKCEKI